MRIFLFFFIPATALPFSPQSRTLLHWIMSHSTSFFTPRCSPVYLRPLSVVPENCCGFSICPLRRTILSCERIGVFLLFWFTPYVPQINGPSLGNIPLSLSWPDTSMRLSFYCVSGSTGCLALPGNTSTCELLTGLTSCGLITKSSRPQFSHALHAPRWLCNCGWPVVRLRLFWMWLCLVFAGGAALAAVPPLAPCFFGFA